VLVANDQIAERFVLSPATVRTHVSRAMIKLGARDRAQLVVFAYQNQLVDTYVHLDPNDGQQTPDLRKRVLDLVGRSG
jgi:hypothetical protein